MNSIAEGMGLQKINVNSNLNRESPEWSQILSRQATYFELLLVVVSNDNSLSSILFKLFGEESIP